MITRLFKKTLVQSETQGKECKPQADEAKIVVTKNYAQKFGKDQISAVSQF